MREENQKSGMENLASHRIRGVLPKKYHMEYRSGQEELVEEKSLKQIEQLIRDSSEAMDVPEGLLPENMNRKLLFLRAKKKRKKKIILAGLEVAFLMVVAFGVLVWKNRGAKQETDQLQPITSYDQIYEHYEKLLEKNDPYVLEKNSNLYAVMNGTGNTAMTQSDSDFAAQTADSPISYTSTNLREQGIGEADYTVTDGNYIYTLYSRIVAYDDLTGIPRYELELKICRAEEESAPVVATIGQKYEDNSYYGEWTEPGLYVYGDVLVLLHSECVVEGGWTERTNIRFYDITDRSQPKLLQENVQNGVYKECRVVDGILYVISATTRGMTNGLKKEKQERYVPMLNGQKLPQGDIYLREEVQGNAYDIVSSWDLSNQGKMVDVKAMIGYYQDIYMTQDSLYFSNTIYADLKEHDETDRTQISKFTCDNGKMRAVAVTTFPGTLDSSFAIQESGEELWVTAQVQHYVYREKLGDAGGNFRKDGAKAEERIEGTGQDDIEDLEYWYGYEDYRTWTDVSVYTFDSKLQPLDSLGGLVRNEDIYAVRYIGQIGYFVSYEQTDPLLSIDFSDSHHLKKLDELEMPGFSRYLHPLSDNLLLGIGEDDNGKVKLDLYDVADPRKLSRLDKELVTDMWSCAVFYNYKWILIDEENQMFGVAMGNDRKTYYLLYRYDREEGLKQIQKTETKQDDSCICQGFRIGDVLYLVGKNEKCRPIKVVPVK